MRAPTNGLLVNTAEGTSIFLSGPYYGPYLYIGAGPFFYFCSLLFLLYLLGELFKTAFQNISEDFVNLIPLCSS